MPRIMVTGINGFVGKHLAHELNSQNCEVIGVGRDHILDRSLDGVVSDYHACDMTDVSSVEKLPLTSVDAIINLAGLAKIGESFDKPDLYKHVNVSVLTIIGARLLSMQSGARIIAVSTGAVYDSSQEMPLSEDSRLVTTASPYAISKIVMEEAAVSLRSSGLNCVVVRPFNHIGPGQEAGFLVPDLYAKIQGSLSTSEPLKVGNLSTRRDYTDVRDVARYYASLALANSLEHTVYNVCSGRSIEGSKILELLIDECHGKDLEIVSDPSLFRPNDPEDLYGSNELLRAATGWQPVIPIEQTVRDFVTSQQS